MSIRARLLFLVLVIFVPAFLAAGIGITYVYTEAYGAYRQSMRETTRALAGVLDTEIAKRESILHTLAVSDALDKGDFEAFYRLAQQATVNQENRIALMDATGQQLLNTRVPYGTGQLPKSSRSLREQYGPDETVVSNLYFAPFGKQYSFSVEVPVRRDNRILYYMAMGSFASQIQTALEAQHIPEQWIGSIVDRNGVVVARTQDANKYVGQQATGPLLKKLAAQTEGFNEGKTLDGRPVLAFFSRAPASGWVFIVSVPQSELRRTGINAITLLSIVSVILLGLAMVMATLFARNTAKPIEAMRVSAARLGSGERVEVKHSGILEMDAVNVAMAQASEKIHQGKAELERQVAEAVATAERSQRALLQAQKLEALGRLTGGIAHDFNNVLQTLTTGLQVARLSSNDPRATSSLEACQRAVQRATELTGQLLAFGRVQDARLETINLAQQFSVMTPLLQGALPSNIQLQLDVAEPLWPITIDPLQFELALLNLTMNARDAMPQGGVLHIEARNENLAGTINELEPGDYVRLSVTDSGEGMTEEVLAKALDPFFTTKPVGKGSGMGLPQVYGFARQAGGVLTLHSKLGEGTTAILYLPRASVVVHAQEPVGDAAGRAAPGTSVLFVEDDPLVKGVVAQALEAEGFRVTLADNADAAMALLESRQDFDVVFSDVVMPGRTSGIDLAELVRQRFPSLRVVLATGYSDRRTSLPHVRILPKPYRVADVVAALNDALRTRGDA